MAKTTLKDRKGLIVYSGQSRFFKESIELQSKAIGNLRKIFKLDNSDFQLDVMLSTWKKDTQEDDIDALNKWTHGDVFLRLIEETVFDKFIEFEYHSMTILEMNSIRTVVGKTHALCNIYDLTSKYDFFILTRTDYHVPCLDFKDAKFYNEILTNAYCKITTVLDGVYSHKGGWNFAIDDNYVVIPSNLVYVLGKGRIEDIESSIINYADEERIFSAHALVMQLLCKLHTECDRYYDETDGAMRDAFRHGNRIGFYRYYRKPKFIRRYEVVDALLSDYSVENWDTLPTGDR